MTHNDIVTAELELTDTYQGEANYAWVKRVTMDLNADEKTSQIIRKLKAKMGISHLRHRKEDLGDMVRLRFDGLCMVGFITFH